MGTIFVSGAGGFIGRNTIPLLLSQGHRVVALQRQSGIVPAQHAALTVVVGDLGRDDGAIANALRGCDTLLHLAGDTTPSRSATDMDLELSANLVPLLRMLEFSKASGIRRVVLSSSGGTVYGRPHFTPIDESHPTEPTTPYGLGKLAAEHVARLWATQNNREFVLLRTANPYGPHQTGRNDQGVIGVWLNKARRDEPLVVWGDGTSTRDYLYVGDLAAALSIACTLPSLPSGIYNIGSGRGHSLLQIAEVITQATGKKPSLQFVAARPYDVVKNILSIRRFSDATGWMPAVELAEGIRLTLRFLQDSER